MMRFTCFITLILSGCAINPPNVSAESSADLCIKYLAYPGNIWREHRQAELVRRGENCSAYVGLAAAQANADAATMALGVSLLNSGGPYTMPTNQTRCQTRKIGNTWNTICE